MATPTVFISYARGGEQDEHVEALRSSLQYELRQRLGIPDLEVFLDVAGIRLGENWQQTLHQALAETRALVVLMTPLWFGSDHCLDEYSTYVELHGTGAPVFPVRWVPEFSTPQNERAHSVWERLSELQAPDWTTTRRTRPGSDAFRSSVHALADAIVPRLSVTEAALPNSGPGLVELAQVGADDEPPSDPASWETSLLGRLWRPALALAATLALASVSWVLVGSDTPRTSSTTADEGTRGPTGPTVEHPEWVTNGSGAFGDEQVQVFYAVGAKSGVKNPALLRSASRNQARAEMQKLGEVYSTLVLANAPYPGVRDVVVDAIAKTLDRTSIVDLWIHPIDGTMYSLARLDVSAFIQSLETYRALSADARAELVSGARKAFFQMAAETSAKLDR